MMSARETVSHIVLSETRVLVLLRGNKERKQHLLCFYLLNFEDLGRVT